MRDGKQPDVSGNGFRTAAIVLAACMLALLLGLLLFGRDLFSADQLRIFFMDVRNTAQSVGQPDGGSVVYTSGEDAVFCAYRGGFAVVGKQTVTVFSASGRQTVSDQVRFASPAVASSGNYLLAYDAGGTGFCFYSAYVKNPVCKSDYPIVYAAVADNGNYALVTRTADSVTAVKIYDRTQKLLGTLTCPGLASCCSFSRDGDRLAVLSITAQGGEWMTDLSVCRAKNASLTGSRTLEGFCGVSCGMTDGGTVFCLSWDALRVVPEKGEVTAIDFPETPLCAAFDENYFVAAVPDGDGQTVIRIYDEKGKETAITPEPSFVSVTAKGGYLYIVYKDKVQVRKTSGGGTSETVCDTEGRVLIVRGSGGFWLCGGSIAECYRN
ncbi:MAG: hypothetical protein IJR83_07255 [Clostridia bacterium]|nr:hypothetical protein [Clostridia bacterium]